MFYSFHLQYFFHSKLQKIKIIKLVKQQEKSGIEKQNHVKKNKKQTKKIKLKKHFSYESFIKIKLLNWGF